MKLLVMKNAYKLKGISIFITDELPSEVLEIRKKSMPQFRDEEGKFATLKYDKLRNLIKQEATPFGFTTFCFEETRSAKHEQQS